METLRTYLTAYLALREAFGFQRRTARPLLVDFVGFIYRKGHAWITPDLALEWARLPEAAQPAWWAYRLRVVCGFADFVHGRQPRSRPVPRDLLPLCRRRRPPYLYREDV